MALIRSIADIARKWTDVTPARRQIYEANVKAPLRDWQTEAMAREDAWDRGVEEARAAKRFGKGVRKVGTEKWKKRASLVGPGRWAEGVRIAGPEYLSGFGPYRDEIEKVVLPPRGPAGDPENYRRVEAIGIALRKKKLELLG